MSLCAVAGGSLTVALAQTQTAVRVCTRVGPGFFERDAALATSGMEADILKSFAAATKTDLVFEEAPSFAELLTWAEQGRCDIASARITVTEDRKKRLAFTTPYFPNRVLVVQKAQGVLAKLEDLKDHKVAVEGGTHLAKLISELPGVSTVHADKDEALFEAVAKGEADALACDSAVVLNYLAHHSDFSVAFPVGDRSFFAFALPLNSAWTRSLSSHMKTITKNGEFEKILAKHFGKENAKFLASELKAELGKP